MAAGIITVSFKADYTGCNRVCYRIGNSAGYTCVNVTCAGGGADCSVDIPVNVNNDGCYSVDFEGYVQACCKDIASTDGRVPFQATFTPTPISPALALGTADSFVILSGAAITNGTHNQLVTGNTGHTGALSDTFTYASGGDFAGGAVGTTGTPGTPLGDAYIVKTNILAMAPTFSFAAGNINLSTDVTNPSGIPGTFIPGIYLITGDATIGAGGIIFSGAGNYIFIITGQLITTANSTTFLSNSAQNFKVFYVPASASIGANSTLVGNIITAGAIVAGNSFALNKGRLLSTGGNITIGSGTNVFTKTADCV